jgi:hypothetical protein
LITITPWFWFYQIPGVDYLASFYNRVDSWIVGIFNSHLLHVKDTLNFNGGGSGDTSYAWAQFYTYLILSLLGCLVWTLVDRKREKYVTLDFILRNVVRYNIAMIAFSYGIIKLFSLQMPFPNLTQLVTPLGDFLPMRLSWMFLGYSTPYQAFSGIMEIIVGVLLLNRKTLTLGALMGVAVFTHVFLLNLSYDIPVKLFSMHLVIYCLFLASYDWRRIVDFFFLNKTVSGTKTEIELTKKWQRVGRVVWKIAFVVMFILLPIKEAWATYKTESKADDSPINSGIYIVKTFKKNNDTISVSSNDDMTWKDFIFDKGGIGSINTLDTLFKQRYRRGYFSYIPDTVRQVILFRRFRDTTPLFELQYKIPDEKRIDLWGKVRDDSLFFELVRTDRHFQLTEKQFHWISEANR